MHQKQLRDSMMYAMRIGQDHEDSSKKSGRDPSRREAGESVRRHDGTFQSRVTVKIQLLHCVCRPVLKGVFVDLLKAKSEALASLKKFVRSVGTPKKLRQDNAKEILSEQFKNYCLYAGILKKKTLPDTTK